MNAFERGWRHTRIGVCRERENTRKDVSSRRCRREEILLLLTNMFISTKRSDSGTKTNIKTRKTKPIEKSKIKKYKKRQALDDYDQPGI